MNQIDNDDEILLLHLIRKIKGSFYIVKQNLLWLFLSVLIGGVSGYFIENHSETIYSSSSVFSVQSSQSSNPLASALSFASQLGLNLGGGSSMNNATLVVIAKSKTSILNALMDTITYNGKTERIVNLYLEADKKKHEKENILFDFKSFLPNNRSIQQDSFLNNYYKSIIKNNIEANDDVDNGCVNIIVKSKNRNFSVAFATKILKYINNFFVKNQKQQQNLVLNSALQKTDSISSALKQKQFQLAQLADSRINLIKQQGHIAEITLSRDISLLNVMYAEANKNLELLKLNQSSRGEMLVVIDAPQLTIDNSEKHPLKFAILLSIASMMICLTVIISINYYNSIKHSL